LFVRFTPAFEFPYTTVLNGVFFMAVALLLALWWRGKVRWSYLTASGLVLLLVGILMPLNWFAGMGAISSRFVFPGVLILLSQMQLRARVVQIQSISAVLLLVVAVISVVFAGIVQKPFQSYHQSMNRLFNEYQDIIVIPIHISPIHNRCLDSWGNLFSVTNFTGYQIPFYSVSLTEETIRSPVFTTSLLQRRSIEEKAEEEDVQSFRFLPIIELDGFERKENLQSIEIESTSVVAFIGCPAHLDYVDGFVNTDLDRLESSDSTILIYTSAETRPLLTHRQ
jgi:hypothetical protein